MTVPAAKWWCLFIVVAVAIIISVMFIIVVRCRLVSLGRLLHIWFPKFSSFNVYERKLLDCTSHLWTQL